jgi:small multidrug resistance pump
MKTKLASSLTLFLAIIFEVLGTTFMKMSDGFKLWLPSSGIPICYSISFVFLAISLKRLDVSVAYAVWSGLGTVFIVFVGVLFFSEPIYLIKLLALALIILGVIGLQLSGKTSARNSL